MSSSFGKAVRYTIFGESHGDAVGIVIEGLPSGEKVDEEQLMAFMKRRQGGGALSTPRREEDRPHILSGLYRGYTTGTPLCAIIENHNTRSSDYASLLDTPRPSHADYPAQIRYHGYQDPRGGGHFSGRLTAPLCIAGGIALQILHRRGVAVGAHIASIGSSEDVRFDAVHLTPQQLCSPGRATFPVIDAAAGERMKAEIRAAIAQQDSVGGTIECGAVGVPAGMGSPMFDGMENQLAAALFGIPAVKGVEFGAGFSAAAMLGSEHNDPYIMEDGAVRTKTNHHGGIIGGITTGMPLILRAAVKPTPSIGKPQQTVRISDGSETTLEITGRHDPCIVVRAVPCVESAVAAVLLDIMQQMGL